jgi:hypothetical protein
VGTNSITATYNGSGSFFASTSHALSQVVNKNTNSPSLSLP